MALGLMTEDYSKPALDEARQWLGCNRSNYLKEDSLIYEESYEKATKIS